MVAVRLVWILPKQDQGVPQRLAFAAHFGEGQDASDQQDEVVRLCAGFGARAARAWHSCMVPKAMASIYCAWERFAAVKILDHAAFDPVEQVVAMTGPNR
jgi:hypothetical protein